MFVDYVAWAKVMLSQRKVLASDLAFHLECLAEVLEERLPAEAGTLAVGFVEAAVRAMAEMPEDMPTFLHEDEPLSPLAHQYFEALRRGDRHLAGTLVLEAVAAGTSVKDIYLHVFQPAQYEIGRLWQTNRITVARGTLLHGRHPAHHVAALPAYFRDGEERTHVGCDLCSGRLARNRRENGGRLL